MNTFPSARIAAIAALALIGSVGLRADESIVNTGSGGAVETGRHLGGYSSTSPTAFTGGLAGEFSLTGNVQVTSIYGWIGDNITGTLDSGGLLNISILSNDPNTGTVDFSQDFTVPSDQAPAWTGIDGLDLDLGPGSYWVEFSSPDESFVGFAPHTALTSPLSDYAYSIDGGGFDVDADYDFGVQINGNVLSSSVPDSGSTVLLVAAGMIGLCALAARRKLGAA
jgi:hypothetical protein